MLSPTCETRVQEEQCHAVCQRQQQDCGIERGHGSGTCSKHRGGARVPVSATMAHTCELVRPGGALSKEISLAAGPGSTAPVHCCRRCCCRRPRRPCVNVCECVCQQRTENAPRDEPLDVASVSHHRGDPLTLYDRCIRSSKQDMQANTVERVARDGDRLLLMAAGVVDGVGGPAMANCCCCSCA